MDYDALGGVYTTVFGRYPRAVVDLICAEADRRNQARVAHLGVYLVVSGWFLNPNVEVHTDDGDIAGAVAEDSYGIGQVNLRAGHPGPGSRYLGLDGLRTTMDLMKDRWDHAWYTAGGWSGWIDDVYAFQATFHAAAQGSIKPFPNLVRQAYARASLLDNVWLRDQHAQQLSEWEARATKPLRDLSPTWTLRVGLAQIALDGGLSASEAAQRLRETLDAIP
jgi:hypothetical protein